MVDSGGSAVANLTLNTEGFTTGIGNAISELNNLKTAVNDIGSGSIDAVTTSMERLSGTASQMKEVATSLDTIANSAKSLSSINSSLDSMGVSAETAASGIRSAINLLSTMNADFTSIAEGITVLRGAIAQLSTVGTALTGVSTKIRNIASSLEAVEGYGSNFTINIENQFNGAGAAAQGFSNKVKTSMDAVKTSTEASLYGTERLEQMMTSLNFAFGTGASEAAAFSNSLRYISEVAALVYEKIGLVIKEFMELQQFALTGSTIEEPMLQLGEGAGEAGVIIDATTNDVIRLNGELASTGSAIAMSGSVASGELERISLAARSAELGLKEVQTTAQSMSFGMSGYAQFGSQLQGVETTAKETTTAMKETATATKTMGAASESAGGKVNTLRDRVNELDKASGLLRRTLSLLVVMIGMNLVMGLYEAGSAAINARENIKSMGNLMGWSSEEVQKFTDNGRELQKVYRKIDMSQVESQVAGIAQQYGLGADEATQFTETAAVFTAAMKTEGRSTEDATLALKDFIDQGTGWARRMQEIGVTEDKLKATGLWKGDKNDVHGLIAALGELEKEMHLIDRARQINNPMEGIEAIKSAFGNIMADLYEMNSSDITAVFRIINATLWKIDDAIIAIRDAWAALPLPDWAKQAIGATAFSTGITLIATALTLKMLPSLVKATAGLLKFIATARAEGVWEALIGSVDDYRAKLDKLKEAAYGTAEAEETKKTAQEGSTDASVIESEADEANTGTKVEHTVATDADAVSEGDDAISTDVNTLSEGENAIATTGATTAKEENSVATGENTVVKEGNTVATDIETEAEAANAGVTAAESGVKGTEGALSGWGTLKSGLTKVVSGFVIAAVAIAAIFALIAEVLLLLMGEMYILAEVGKYYKAKEKSIKAGIEGIATIGPLLLVLGAGVSLLLLGMTVLAPAAEVAIPAMAAGGAMAGIGILEVLLLLTEFLIGLEMPMWALAEVGKYYTAKKASINAGVKGVGVVGEVLTIISQNLNILLPAVAIFGAMPIAGVLAGAGIVVSLKLLVEFINGLKGPLNSISNLGNNLPNMASLQKGIKGIQLTAIALNALASAFVAIGSVNWNAFNSDILAKLQGNGGYQETILKGISAVNNIIQRINTIQIGNVSGISAKVAAMKQVTVAINQLGATFTSINNAINVMSNTSVTGTTGSVTKIVNAMKDVSSLLSQLNAIQITAPNFSAKIQAMVSLNSFLVALIPLIRNIQQAGTTLGGGLLGGGISQYTNMIVSGVKSIFDLANKLKGAGGSGVNLSGVSSVVSGLNNLVKAIKNGGTQIKGAASNWYTAGSKLGTSLSTGFKASLKTFNSSVLSTVTGGIRTVQSRYNTWRSAGAASGTQLANGYKSTAHKLTEYVIQELGYAIQAIQNRYDTFYQAGYTLGQREAQGYADGSEHHSPGRIARDTADEMQYTLEAITSQIPVIQQKATELGTSLVQGYKQGNTGLGVNTSGISDSLDATKLSALQQQQASYNSQMQTQALQNANTIQTINNQTATNTTGQYTQLGQTMGTTFNQMGLTATNAFHNIGNTNSQNMKKITTDVKTGMSQANTHTKQQLTQMKNTTLQTVTQMNKAWQNMRGTIVNAASQIQVQSYQKFSSLHTSIASFYNQLASAHFSAGLPAGPGGSFTSVRGNGGTGRIRSSGGPTISTVHTEMTGGFEAYGSPSINESRQNSKLWLDLLGTNNEDEQALLEALALSEGCQPGDECYFGDNTVATNYNRIKTTADNWSIADPWFLGIQIPMDNYVRDFEDGKTKRIDASNFESILRLVLTTKGFANPGTYQFYSGDHKSNQQVWDEVACNCYDGAQMIMEIGNMLGLESSMAHGMWGSYSHAAAIVGGQLYDMTQFQKRGVFRGSSGVYFGSPSSSTSTEQYGSNSVNTGGKTGNQTVVNVSFDGATIVGEEGLKDKIKDLIVRTIYEERSTNPNTGL